MDKAQVLFLEILCSAMQGNPYDLHIKNETVLLQILCMASQHHILPMIFEAIYQSESMHEYPELFAKYKKRAVDETAAQTLRTAQFCNLYYWLDCRGLRPLIVKGLTMRRLYPYEDFRSSSDEDLLISPEMKLLYHEALLEYGMVQVKPQQNIADAQELSYIHPGTGLYLEVHQYLFPPESDAYGDLNRFFENIESVEFDYRGQKMYTLNPTDNLLFLICHSFKHFLHSGFGIRQICDLVMFSDAYADTIDWDRIWRLCGEINGRGFLQAMYHIGNKYLMKENRYTAYLKEWNIEKTDVEPLLLDVLASGVYGTVNMTRRHSSNMTLKAMINYKNCKKIQVLYGVVYFFR